MSDPTKPDADGWFRKNIVRSAVDSIISGSAKAERKEAGSQAFQLSYACSDSDMQMIFEIAARAIAMYQAHGLPTPTPYDIAIDVATMHCNGNPLKLMQFMMSDNADFQRDLVGLRIHLDRRTGQLMNGWRPIFGEVKQ